VEKSPTKASKNAKYIVSSFLNQQVGLAKPQNP
jgi:hypothetical protein